MNTPAHLLRNNFTHKRESLRQTSTLTNNDQIMAKPTLMKRCSVTLASNYSSMEMERRPNCQYNQQVSPKYFHEKIGLSHSTISENYIRNQNQQSKISQFCMGEDFLRDNRNYGYQKNRNSQRGVYLTQKYTDHKVQKKPIEQSKPNDPNPTYGARYSLIDISNKDNLQKSTQLSNNKQIFCNDSLQETPNNLKYQLSTSNYVTVAAYNKKIEQIEQSLSNLDTKIRIQSEKVSGLVDHSGTIEILMTLGQKHDEQIVHLRSNLADFTSEQYKADNLQINQDISSLRKQMERINFDVSFTSQKLEKLVSSKAYFEEQLQKKMAKFKSEVFSMLPSHKQINPSLDRFPSINLKVTSFIQDMHTPDEPIQIEHTYKIDQEGYLLDQDQNYINDQNGVLYRLEEPHIQMLREYGIIKR